jgi:HSP20 family protein
MALVIRRDPFFQEFDRLFDTVLQGRNAAQRWVPAMDLAETEDDFVLKADLPGLSEEDVAIEIEGNTLTVSGERRSEHEQDEGGWHRVERSFGSFSRSLTLPQGVEPDAVTAEFDRGVLSVRIPKPEAHKPRRVEITARGENGQPAMVEGTAEEK